MIEPAIQVRIHDLKERKEAGMAIDLLEEGQATMKVLSQSLFGPRRLHNTAAFSLGQLVGGGELSEDLVRSRLTTTAKSIGLGGHEARLTINSGLKHGKSNPRSAPAPTFARPSASSANGTTLVSSDPEPIKKKVTVAQELETETSTSPEIDPAKVLDLVSWDLEVGENDDAEIDTPTPNQTPPATLLNGRAQLAHLVQSAIKDGGRTMLKGACGLGKSYAVAMSIVEWLMLPENKGRRVTIAVPTRANVEDMYRLYLDFAGSQGLTVTKSVTRTEKNCERFAETTLANRCAPNGGGDYCRQCPISIARMGRETTCPFWWAFLAREEADITITTHALELQQAPMDDDTVRIDWSAIDERANSRQPARPFVVRTKSGFKITAKYTAESEGGTLIPTPEWTEYRAWTSEAKTSFLEWVAEAWDLDENWREEKAKEAREGGTRLFIDWSKIAERRASHANYVPHSYWEPTGWHKGWHIGVRRALSGESGSWLPPINFTPARSREDASQEDVYRWLSKRWGCDDSLVSVDDYARGHVDRWPTDVLVIDESLWPSMRAQSSLSIGDVAALNASGDLEDLGGLQPLLRLLHLSQTSKDRRVRKCTSSDLADAVPVDSLAFVGHSLGEQQL